MKNKEVFMNDHCGSFHYSPLMKENRQKHSLLENICILMKHNFIRYHPIKENLSL